MKKYLVGRREVWRQLVYIEAEDEKDAVHRVREGEGEDVELEFGLEYTHTLDSSLWDVVESQLDLDEMHKLEQKRHQLGEFTDDK